MDKNLYSPNSAGSSTSEINQCIRCKQILDLSNSISNITSESKEKLCNNCLNLSGISTLFHSNFQGLISSPNMPMHETSDP